MGTKTKEIGRLIREFLEYLELERGHSQLTIRNYDAYLKNFAQFMDGYLRTEEKATEEEAGDATKINLEMVKAWRLALHRKKLSNKTANYYIIALRSFLKYLAKMDIYSLSAEKIELAETPERTINFLEPEELQRLLGAYGEGDLAEARNRAILETLFSTGLRVSELIALDRDKINLERGEFSVVGKGGKGRVVFLSNSAAEWLKKYLEARNDEERALFAKSQISKVKSQKQNKKIKDEGGGPEKYKDLGGRLTARQIERIVQDGATRAGIVKKVTPHVLRHSFATDILRAGADIRSVQSLLGHQNVTTTQVYTHVTDKHLRDIHQRFHNIKPNSEKGESEKKESAKN